MTSATPVPSCDDHFDSLVRAFLDSFGTVDVRAICGTEPVPCSFGSRDGRGGCGKPSIAEVSR